MSALESGTKSGHLSLERSGDLSLNSASVLRGEYYRAWRRFARNRVAILGLIILIFCLVCVSVGPYVYGRDPNAQNLSAVLAAPSMSYPLGTDELGRDILSRILYGGRISLIIGVIAVFISFSLGTTIGIVSGYIGHWTDEVIMRLTDILMAFPGFLLALLMLSILGPGLYQAMVAVGITYAPRFIRLSRASTLSVKERDFVLAAVALGQRHSRIIYRHILPNILGPIIVQATLLIGVAILIAASLGFLGLGIQPPTPEWGNMLSTGRDYLTISPYVVVFPGIAIMVVVLSFNLIGDGLRDVFDVQLS